MKSFNVRVWQLVGKTGRQARIHKPLLLEEFGKIVWEKDIPKGYIEKKRNPVYEAMTGITMDSVKQCVDPGLNALNGPRVSLGGHPVQGLELGLGSGGKQKVSNALPVPSAASTSCWSR